MIDKILHPSDWYDWLLVYVLIGLLGLVVLGINALRTKPSSFEKTIMSSLGRKRTLKDVIQDWFVYAVAAVCVVIGWPGFLVWLALEKKREAKNNDWYALPDFTAAPEFFIKEVKVSEVELENVIYDPLGQTPKTPFGHLNKAWEIFKSKKPMGSELQLFQIPKGSKIGKFKTEAESEIKGYAWVLNEKVAEEFISEEG